ncbi:MAG: ribonuclease H-like domain-containing protein [Treponema sp.]|jgi:uncharacterized protein YprB with RNaseH-like and TPR domain|nr:ribonuclease H-like domain-containing protein [Treponema sp.]
MPQSLKDRLRRIRDEKKNEATPRKKPAEAVDRLPFEARGWISAGFCTLKREIPAELSLDLPVELSPALPLVIPDLGRRIIKDGASVRPPLPEDFMFFDLETTGLSGGAGTIAFLAAFGRLNRAGGAGKFLSPNRYELHITQYLLLDYPGENDFLDALLGEFRIRTPVIVSYNGKCFDSQILKTRCLMNGIQTPEYQHVDLLHPARRLWKRIFDDCSQITIESRALGINRGGDIPGALAPEIWFAFLKNGDVESLLGICDHNCGDIRGLACIFAAINHIAADPCGLLQKYNYDIENLALRWREALRDKRWDKKEADILRDTGRELLRLAAEKKFPRAALIYALDLLRRGDYAEGRLRLLQADAAGFPSDIRAAALRYLAIDSEWRLKNVADALELAKRGLELPLIGKVRQEEFERRVERLRKKLEMSA